MMSCCFTRGGEDAVPSSGGKGDVVIRKPDTHRREYVFMELENGLRAIIGSDPSCDKAGAALAVNVGMCHERQELPGLAHFLEHMLFAGTTKYPKEGEYHEFMNQNGGAANAYTTCYFTNYMFEVKPEALQEGLDRFARFFTEPILSKDATDREINAVDSEFQGGMTHPWWRYIGIMNMSANPDHPFHVACGNVQVLRDEPKAKNIDLYEEMLKFYKDCYSSNGMTLCIIGRETIGELRSIVKDLFGPIINKKVQMPIGDNHSDQPPFRPADWNRLLLQNPVQDIKELTFTWVIPFQNPLWRSKPTAYIAHLLGHEGAGSLTAVLKQQGLISACGCDNGKWLEGSFSLLNVSFDLTEKGLDHIEQIGSYMFAFIGMLQKMPVQQWIYDEMRMLEEIKFKFSEDQHPFQLCQDMALRLQHLPPSEILAGASLLYEYDPVGIAAVLAKLTLDGVRVQHQAKTLADRCTDKDTSYGSPMIFVPLEAAWRTKWAAALNPGGGSVEESNTHSKSLGLSLPKPNPFIPEDVALRPLPESPPAMPVLLKGLEPPLACVFHRQDDILKQPKAHATFLIYTPFLCESAVNMVRTELWCRCVEESLNEFAYDADIAGVTYGFGLGAACVKIDIAGFNDKLGVLLDAVTSKITSMREIPENIYSIVADAFGDELSNSAFHSPPYAQCGMRFTELTNRGAVFPAYKRFEAFKGVKRESLTGIIDRVFHAEGVHVEALVLGNTTPEEAKQLAMRLKSGLQLAKPLKVLPERAEAAIPDGNTVWRLDGTDAEEPNHAVFVRCQLKESVETDMLLQLASKVLSAKFFDDLRTQQQLGYIVHLGEQKTKKFVYLIAVIQTEYPTDYTRSRINTFLEEKFAQITLEDEEVETCRSGLLSDLKMQHKTLGEEAGRYIGSIANRTYDFERRSRCIQFVETVSSKRLRDFITGDLAKAPRMYSQVKKTSPKEDKALPEGASIPEDPASLRVWTTHEETVKTFAASATWLATNSAVDAANSRL